MNRLTYLIVFIISANFCSFSQVGINTTTPDPSSILEIESTSQGLLLPRMTATQRDNIASPAEGLFIYNLDSSCFQYYRGSSWSGCIGEFPGNSLDCSSTVVNGIYPNTVALNANNTITINVLVNVIEPYTINTDTVNGYSFSGSGVFSTIGLNTITLSASGSPIVAQTDTFTITFVGKGDTCTTNVTVTSVLPANCLAYYNTGSTTDGIYSIDPDGAGGNPAYDCYCDMTNDGGGWTLVFNNITTPTTGFWANDAQANEFNIGSPGLTTNKYSILSKLNEIKSATDYEFRLYYPDRNLRNHWTQTVDPRVGSPGADYVGINIQMNQNNWNGLELSGGNTYLDGSVGSGNWYYSIGSNIAWNNGMPANNATSASSVQLFVR